MPGEKTNKGLDGRIINDPEEIFDKLDHFRNEMLREHFWGKISLTATIKDGKITALEEIGRKKTY